MLGMLAASLILPPFSVVHTIRPSPPLFSLGSKLLPPGLVAAIQDGPGEAAVAALGTASETPERVWNRGMHRAAAEEAAHLAASARVQQASVQGGAVVPNPAGVSVLSFLQGWRWAVPNRRA
mgnify:CR=1 FL=1